MDFSQLLPPETLFCDSWNLGVESNAFDAMSGLGVAQDYPDLDELLDIGDASDIVAQCGPNQIGSFGHDDTLEVLDWYNQSDISQSHYESQIEYEKEKKENEAGLLEALQKSMDLECGNVSDLVSLSSSLVQPPLTLSSGLQTDSSFPTTSLTSTFPPLSFPPETGLAQSPSNADSMSVSSAFSSGTEVSFEEPAESDESMLKTLLLSQTNIHYPREVDSNNNLFEQSLMSTSKSATQLRKKKRKTLKKQTVAKKPFTELLKHFESTSSTSKASKKPDCTRVVNASRYLKQFGSAPVSRIPSPQEDDAVNAPARSTVTVVTRPSTTVGSKGLGRKQSVEVLMPTRANQIPTSKKSKTPQNKLFVAPDANSLLDILENRSSADWKPQSGIDCTSVKSRMLIDKRRSTVLIDPLPNKRQRINQDSKTDNAETSIEEFTELPSEEHDYCHKQANKESGQNGDILNAALQASGLSGQEGQKQTEEELAKSSKILKWQDYLQRVRLGIRSAPNSPTSSPKVRRGSARPVNNFMVLGPPGVAKSAAKPVVRLVEPIVAAKAPKQKTNLKLQEFEEYLAKIQNKPVELATGSNITMPPAHTATYQVDSNAKADTTEEWTVPLKMKRPAKPRSRQVSVPVVSSKSFVKISSGGVVHTAAVASAQTANRNTAPLVMIQIPKLVTSGSSKSQPSEAKDMLLDPRKNLKPRSVKLLKPISKVKWNPDKSVASATTIQTPTQQSQTATSTSTAGPTFKLVTSNKGGVETKSLILSGVSGKLKEILTLLAHQQQQQGATPTSIESSQQQKTLQQLLSAVSNLKTSKTKPTVVSSSDTVAHAQTPSVQQSKPTEPRKTVVPSPLSLIHEIKQNLNKNPEPVPKVSPKTVKVARRPHYVYTVPATSTVTLIQVPGKTRLTSGGGVLTMNGKEHSEQESQVQATLPSHDHNSATVGADENRITVFVDRPDKVQSAKLETKQESLDSVFLDSCQDIDPFAIDGNFSAPSSSQPLFQDNQLSEMDLLAGKDLPFVPVPMQPSSAVDFPSLSDTPLTFKFPNAVAETQPDASKETSIKNDAPVEKTKENLSGESMLDELLAEVTGQTSQITGQASQNTTKLDILESESNVCSTQKEIQNPATVILHSEQQIVRPEQSNSNFELQKSQVVSQPSTTSLSTVEECQEKLQHPLLQNKPSLSVQLERTVSEVKKNIPLCRSMAASEILEETGDNEVMHHQVVVDSSFPDMDGSQPGSVVASQETVDCLDDPDITNPDGMLFNKLPAYLYSGKVLKSESTSRRTSSEHLDSSFKGLKELSNDPLIGTEEANSDLEQGQYNKLPHYLRGGKVCPRMRKSSLAHGSSGSLHSAGVTNRLESYPVLKRTPEGALVNTKELFYSRLPSYLSAGRYHLVETVTEPPPPEDETVTPETIWKHDQEEKRKKREKKKKRKKKRKKQKKHKEKQLEKDRILYSKLPHYFLAGRRSLVPDRRASEQSYSSSLSDTSASEDQDISSYHDRPHSYRRSYSPGRERSASLSSWSSASPSRSPSRSWKNQRRRSSVRSPRRRTVSYSSSDPEYSTSRSRTRKRRRSYSSDSDYEGKRRKKVDDQNQQIKKKAIQERRVMYVGGIDDDVTKSDLRRRFEKFGTIEEVCLHFRKDRDSYAFVTFRYTCDTFSAIEQGNNDVTQTKYTLCFGGRREFCQVEYADLDEAEGGRQKKQAADDDFDTLLKQAMKR